MNRRAASIAFGFAFLGLSAPAYAADADTLFAEGNALVASGHFAEGCAKLAESDRIGPAIGTRFNLADCYEQLGRTATAHALFVEVARVARAAGKFERERLAKERAATLAPRLAKIRLDVRADAEVRIDDQVVPREHWREPLPFDPGAHHVSAKAPGRVGWQADVTAREAAIASVVVPELAAETGPNSSPDASAPDVPARSSTQKTIAIVVGTLGLAALATGAVAGPFALSRRSRAEEACPEATYHFRCPTPDGADDWTTAHTAGTVSTVALIGGGVALAVGVALWITRPRGAVTAALAPWRF